MFDVTALQTTKLDYARLHAAISTLRSKQIFFAGGTIKSGTTWLQLLLDAHPEVSCNGEGHFLDYLAPSLKQAVDHHWKYVAEKNRSIFRELEGYPRLTDADFLYILASCIALFLIEQSKHKDVRAVGERTPNNIEHFAALDTLFPTAKFIQIVRDGRDCAVSGWFHNLRVTPDWTMKNFGSLDAYVRGFAGRWANELAKAQQFADRYRGRVLRVRYEDLAADAEGVLANLFDFLGVDRGETVLARCRSDASFVKLSGGRSPGEENRRSFFRKGVAGDWRNHLSGELEAEFRKKTNGWIDRLGYK
jgi:hypothetical protein